MERAWLKKNSGSTLIFAPNPCLIYTRKKGRKCIKVSNRCMVAIKLRGPTINQLRVSHRLMEHFCGSRSLSGLLVVDVGGLKQGRGMFFDILVLHIEEYI